MKLVILDAKTLGSDIDLSVFKQFGQVEIYPTTLKKETAVRVKDADIIITNKVIIDKNILDNCQNLKLICIAATGMNNVDLEYAKQKHIRVTNVAGYSTKSVTQHTFSMLFYLLENMRYYDEFVKDGNWEKKEIFTNIDKPFFEISGKKWGIIGMGAIGQEVAKIAQSFGCEVIYYSTSGKNAEQPYTRVSLKQLMKTSQIISIHAPLNETTQDLICDTQLNLMQEGAAILNLGRGHIINEDDLAQVIDTKKIYAGLDVTSSEPLSNDCALMNIKNKDRLLITPHIAWTSFEAREELIKGIIKNIKDYLRDHTL